MRLAALLLLTPFLPGMPSAPADTPTAPIVITAAEHIAYPTRIVDGVVSTAARPSTSDGHTLRINAVDRTGAAPAETLAWVINLRDVAASPPDPVLLQNGVGQVVVAPGYYAVTSAIATVSGDLPPDLLGKVSTRDDPVVESISIATIAETPVFADTTCTLDARLAQPISAAIADAPTVPVDVQLAVAARHKNDSYVLSYATSAQDVIDGKLFVQPTTPARHGRLELSSKWRLNSADSTYDLLFADNRFPSSMAYIVAPRDLSRLTTTYRTPAMPATYLEARFITTTINPVSVAIPQPTPPAPLVRTEFVNDGDWFQCANLILAEAGVGNFCQPTQRSQDWVRAPLHTRAGVFRSATTIYFGLDDLASTGPSSGSISDYLFTHRSHALYRNGVLLREGQEAFGNHEIPADKATFRLTRVIEQNLLPMSTRVETSWTFTVAPPHRPGTTRDAVMLDVSIHAPVDGSNHVGPNPTVTLEAPHGASVTLAMSTDDGKTWQPIALDHHRRARLPAKNGAISLRVTASDHDGNTVDQTIIRALLIRQ